MPVVDPAAWIHPDAQLIGDVKVAAHASVWPGAVLRADFGRIEVGEGSSVQDNCVLHPGSRQPTRIGADCVVGHAAHLEGVEVEDAALVGSGSVVLAGARVCSGAVVAAGAVVLAGFEVRPGQRAQGVPAELVPHATSSEEIRARAREYRTMVRRYAKGLRRLPAVE